MSIPVIKNPSFLFSEQGSRVNGISPASYYSVTSKGQEVDSNLKDYVWNIIDKSYQNEIIHRVQSKIKTQKITTIVVAPLFFIPLRDDFILNESSELQIIPVSSGIMFQISNIVRFQTREGVDLIFGILDNTYNYSQTGVAAILLKIIDFDMNVLHFTKAESLQSPIITYLGTKNDVYPNKVENILIALQQISTRQEKIGGLRKGRSYSYLEMVGLEDGGLYSIYKDGYNKFLSPIRANGICAIATGLSALLHEKKYEPYLFQERWVHKEMYRQGPFSPVRKQVDAAIEFGLETHQNYDLKWIHQTDESLKFDLEIFPTGLDFNETRIDGMAGPSDVGIILSLSLGPIQTQQSDRIQSFLNKFKEFRKSEHASAISDDFVQHTVIYRKLNESNYRDWAKGIYNSGDPRYFMEELKNNPSLQDIYNFSETVNGYEEGTKSLFEFLTKSDWYMHFLRYLLDENNDIDVDKALRKGTFRQIQGQPLQCVGFAMILRDLYPDLGFPDISGTTVAVAGELVPDFVYGLEGRYSTGYGEIALVGKSLTIDDYTPGDLYVIKGYPGHVGTVLAKNENGLLLADSNRLWDGRVNIFYVDERNFDAVFGEEKYIILGHYEPPVKNLRQMDDTSVILKKIKIFRLFE
jgi:hypothetical protein